MPQLLVFVISCSSLLPLAGAEYAGQSQRYDQDDVGLLQSVVNKQTANMDEMFDCPKECSHPQCNAGIPGNPGWKSLEKGKCFFYCKQFRSGRFCGEGDFFEGLHSVNCKGCSGGSSKKKQFADFAFVDKNLGKIEGKFLIDVVEQSEEKRLHSLVEWEVDDLRIEPKLVAQACGKLLHGKPTFNYHLHEQWNFPDGRTSSAFDCSLANVGNHWDPTAACGPASGNQVCDEGFCNTRGKNYTCDPKFFDPYSRAQYRLLTPSALIPLGVTCEFGDFSGMTGPIKAELDQHTGEVRQERPHDGKAAMSATFGQISPKTLQGRPFLSCAFETLPQQGEKRLTYEHATVKTPLDQFPANASVLVHCGNNYENANARFFCALLQGRPALVG